MKYCFNYNKDTEYMECLNKADEITIVYNKKDTTLLEYLDINKNKRINLWLKDDMDLVQIDFLRELTNKYQNLYIKLSFKYYYKDFKYDFKFFFDIPVGDWDTLIGLLEYGVTDVYIVEDLGFELDKVAEIAARYNVQIRVYPNVAQSKFEAIPALKKFFIRPEDINRYEQYIDIIEFYNVDNKLDIYYKIYDENKKWFGRLDEIIQDFNSEIDNRYIIPKFAERRMRCGKDCLKGGNCRRCEVIEQLANSLEQSKLVVREDNERIDK